MTTLSRRVIALGLTAAVLAAAVAFAVQPPAPPTWTFRVQLGVGDAQPADWGGTVAADGGTVVAIEGWRFEADDRVDGTAGWRCKTHDHVAFGKRAAIQRADGTSRYPQPVQPWPNGVTLVVQGAAPKLVLKLAQGEVKFDNTLRTGEPLVALGGRVVVERLPQTAPVRPPAGPNVAGAPQDDYPAFWVHYKSGKQYLAWVCYQDAKDRVLLAERDGPDGAWSAPKEVSKPGYHFRVALATTHGGRLWVVWSEMRDLNWDLYARPYDGGQLGETVRLTDDAGPDLWHRMTTDHKGRGWLVWQGFRGSRSRIFARCVDGDGWHPPVEVSGELPGAKTPVGNAWDPCVAADPTADRVWVGWDVYHGDTYRVAVAALEGGPGAKPGPAALVERSPLFQAHLSLACDRAGRLWAAWDESGPQWGKDTGYLYGGGTRAETTRLYASRSVRIRVRDNDRWRAPKADFTAALPPEMREYNELPQLQPDGDGRMWLAFRHRTCRMPREDGWAAQGRWDLFATACLGDRWTAPTELPHSGGRLDMRTSSQRDRDGNVYFAFAGDNRGWLPPGMLPKNHHVAVSRFAGAARPVAVQLHDEQRTFPPVTACHPDEADQVRRLREYKVEAGGRVYHVYRGDLHRHTDLSVDGMGDGSLTDLHRYAVDAAALDYVLVGDHNMGQDSEYCWWQTQQANDVYTVPGAFISMYGYERSVPYPQGHRNIIWARRGAKTLPLPKPVAGARQNDTAKLYAYLRQTGGICTSHTSATSQGTDWEEPIDPELEPFVELFQGFHASYEAPGAPKTVTDQTERIHGQYEGKGFISSALAKGYKLGFQSSSDHISTHVSYACVLAEKFSREGLVDAMKKRHSYAATDNVVLDVRCGTAIMGDEVRSNRPRFEVVVLGTGPLAAVEVLRDSQVVHTAKPAAASPAEARFTWDDPAPPADEKGGYYYVRVRQVDGQMAWSSPIWVRK